MPSAVLLRAPVASHPTLTQRAWLTALASLLDYGSKLAVGVLVTPILVGYLGRSLFGTWEVLLRLVGYVGAVDGRPMDTLRLVLGRGHAISDADTNRRAVGTAVRVWMFYLPVMASAGALVAWLAPTLAKTPPELVTSVRVTCGLLALNTILAMLVMLPEAVLFGVNQGYRRMGLVASMNLIGALLTVMVVRAGLGLTGLAIAQIAVTAMTGAMFLMLVRRYVEWFGMARPLTHELRSFAALSSWTLVGDMLSKVLLASDVVLLGLLASTAAVTSYVLTGYAAQAVIGILTLVLGAVVPGLAGVVGRAEYERAAAVRREMLSLSWLAAATVGCTILMWNRAFLVLWVGPEHFAGGWSNFLLVLVMAQTMFIRSDSYVINALLQLRARVLISLPAAVLTCGLAVLLVPRLGIPGMCLSVLGGRLAQSFAYPVLVNAALGRPRLSGLRAIARPAVVMLLLFGATAVIGRRTLAANWLTWVVGTAASAGTFLLIAAAFGLDSDGRRPLMQRVRQLNPSIRRWR